MEEVKGTYGLSPATHTHFTAALVGREARREKEWADHICRRGSDERGKWL
jgi:hypothetical protein